MKTRDLPHQQFATEWSNRIILISLLGIAFFTLFPFEFHSTPINDLGRSPFLLGIWDPHFRFLHSVLNALLFVPFGFGLSSKFRKDSGRGWIPLVQALAIGAVVSYTVEFIQLYIPTRDSGWDDVLSNSVGSLIGYFFFELWGGRVIAELSKWERMIQGWLLPRRAAWLLVAYFSVWFGASVHFQNETRLSNWDPRCVLFVGNEASGEDPWKGQVQLLQIWNRALPEKTVKRVVAREKSEDMNTGMLVSYDFSGSSPFRDQRNFLPELKLVTDQTGTTITGATQFDGSSWLSSRLPAENLTLEIKKSNRFTVHVVCTPAETQYARGHIVSLSEIDDNVNFSLRQDQGDLVLWFRNPLSETRSILAWYVRGALEPEKPRDIIASYDGSEAIIYLDGNRVPATFRLSSAAGFAHTFSFIETSGLNGYILVYEIFVFLPAGMLLGLAGRNWNGNQLLGQCLIFLGVGVPAVLLEILAARVGGHGIVAGNIAYALIFGMAGVMLINSDRGGEISRPMP